MLNAGTGVLEKERLGYMDREEGSWKVRKALFL